MLTGTVPEPIPVPIASLRPARVTCQACHWPQQYFAPQYRRLVHFLSDEQNTRWEIHLRVQTGGGGPSLPAAPGIHSHHGGVHNTIQYVAADRARSTIPWIRVTDRQSGLVTEYLARGATRPDQAIATGEPRTMDCIDCHNRAAHRHPPPDDSIDIQMALGNISPTLPAIKKIGVALLAAQYESQDEATTKIESGLRAFYAEHYPVVPETRKYDVAAAVHALQTIYRRGFFPGMKVRWDTYPDHRGHMDSPGCFRCHDGQHVDDAGEVLTHDCGTCHVIVAQGSPGSLAYASGPDGLDFQHPAGIGDLWQSMACSDCHTGGS